MSFSWNAKVGSQEIPWVTGKFGLGVQNEAGQRLTVFCQENALFIANTVFQQHERWLYTWTSTDSQYQHQIDDILCSQKWRSSIQSAKTRPGADYGSDHELLITKFRLTLKKLDIQVWPKSNPLKLYSGSDKWIQGIRSDRQCLKNYGQRFVALCKGLWSKPSPRKRNTKRQNGCQRRLYK